ncbi:MAG: DUF2103 domain-containing protein [Phormidesmis sp.]
MGKKGTGKKRTGKKSGKGKNAATSAVLGSSSKGLKESKGRVVITHSTYIPGLIALLEKLANCPGIQTVTPAVISRVKSNSPKLRLKVSVPITGGHKLIARQRRSAQEVFVITPMSKEALEQAIAQILA